MLLSESCLEEKEKRSAQLVEAEHAVYYQNPGLTTPDREARRGLQTHAVTRTHGEKTSRHNIIWEHIWEKGPIGN